MFKMLEKLINEHEGAKILKERLGLNDDQIVSLQNEFSSLVQENENLKNKNKLLMSSLEQAKQEAIRLEQILDTDAKSNTPEDINDNSKHILKKLFEGTGETTAEDFAEFIDVQVDLIEQNIEELLDKNLIEYGSLMMGEPATYLISEEGRKYVIEVIGI
jgi:hypothetical protein